MKKFVFSLQAALNVKETLETQAKSELMKVQDQLRILNLELDRLIAEFNSEQKKLELEQKSSISAERLKQFNNYFTLLREQKNAVKANIARTELELEKCRVRLIEILKEKKVLEKLKEKQYQEYLLELRKEEEKSISDLISHQVISE